MEERRQAEGKSPISSGVKLSRLSAIITILPASMAAGWGLGYFLCDRWLRSFPWGCILFTLLGAGVGFYEIVRILSRDQNSHDGS